jgi:N-glycosidase YbiA
MQAIEFNSKSEAFSELSNFYGSPITLNSKTYPTVEHFFQSQKFPGDPVLQEKIRMTKTPIGAKRAGRTQSPYFRQDWEEVKETVMLEGLRAKFTQNPQLADLLRSTGTAMLIEKMPRDSYWGSGPNGCGRNRMGRLLEKIRKEI